MPIIAVELAGYCNEDDSRTYHTWCDETHSKLHTADQHLPAMRLAQAKAETLPSVFVVTAMDLGSIHSPHGSIHPVPKIPLGERIATAMRAAVAPSVGLVWAGPTATRAALDGAAVNITFSTLPGAGGIAVDPRMVCPGPILPVFCTGAGFELRSNGSWSAGSISSYGRDYVMVEAAAGGGGAVAATVDAVRYAFADWPVPVVRNRVGGLPARPFHLAAHRP